MLEIMQKATQKTKHSFYIRLGLISSPFQRNPRLRRYKQTITICQAVLGDNQNLIYVSLEWISSVFAHQIHSQGFGFLAHPYQDKVYCCWFGSGSQIIRRETVVLIQIRCLFVLYFNFCSLQFCKLLDVRELYVSDRNWCSRRMK